MLIAIEDGRAADPMPFVYNDGGRKAAGYEGRAGDCVTRAIAIVSGLPYEEVYRVMAQGTGSQRASKRTRKQARSARNGIYVKRKWFRDWMAAQGFVWVPTMRIGQGCKVHLHGGELPKGRLIVSLSRHYTAVIDGIINDTYDPQREIDMMRLDDGGELKAGEWRNENGIWHTSRRCVYGYWHRP